MGNAIIPMVLYYWGIENSKRIDDAGSVTSVLNWSFCLQMGHDNRFVKKKKDK